MPTERRRFGMIHKREDRPGYYCMWRHRGVRYRRLAGATHRAAERALSRVQNLLGEGKSIDHVLGKVFGEATVESLPLEGHSHPCLAR